MHPTAAKYLLLSLAVSVSIFSCVPQKKISPAKKQLADVDSQLVIHSSQLKELDDRRKTKQDQNEIDDTANIRLQKFINRTNAEIDTLINQNTIVIGQTVVNNDDWKRLLKTLSISKKSAKTIGDKISFLNDLISRNMVVKIDQDVLFAPGKYTVDSATVANIEKLFEPAANEINLFTNKYPDFPLSLIISAKGYADATLISEGSSLYKELKDRLKLKGTEPTAQEVNKELSNARAQEVIGLFQKFSSGRSPDGSNLKKVSYLYEGKGDKLPDPKITDYKVDDPRRRVVLLFWSVFPD
jgi:flagellar motor protein MotB